MIEEKLEATTNFTLSITKGQPLTGPLVAFLATGIAFLLLPGTFLGVWNLFAISSAHSSTTVPSSWIQAHGHAQLFGWIGSFILGIGFYSIPNSRRVSSAPSSPGWIAWAAWTTGCALRWFASVYLWHWRLLLPLSAALELLAVSIFVVRSTQRHGVNESKKAGMQPWSALVIFGTIGLLAVVALNLFESVQLALVSKSPSFAPDFNAAFLVAAIWAFPVPIAWGFTAHWMPSFLGLKQLRARLIPLSLVLLVCGTVLPFSGHLLASSLVLLAAALSTVCALRIFEPAQAPAKTQGVHASFPFFVRTAYGWQIVAALLLVWAALEPGQPGIGGAGRHAITVGFLMTLVFSVAPRIIPSFLGRQRLFSQRLMFLALFIENAGCLLRIVCQILAYQHIAQTAWALLPLSATLELSAVVLFVTNMVQTFRQPALVPVCGTAAKASTLK